MEADEQTNHELNINLVEPNWWDAGQLEIYMQMYMSRGEELNSGPGKTNNPVSGSMEDLNQEASDFTCCTLHVQVYMFYIIVC